MDEIDRIRKECGHYKRFSEPTPYCGSKLESFNDLLKSGKDIAVTHVTFLNATQETLDLIRIGEYTLVIDEVLDVIQDFNKAQSVESASRQSVTSADVEFLLDRGIIKIDDGNKVVWLGGEYGDDFKFSEVRKYANLGRLYCIEEKFLLTIFPPEMFACFEQVYNLTYLFKGTWFKYYLDLFNLKCEYLSVTHTSDGYILLPYNPDVDAAFRKKCKSLIHICDRADMNNYKGSMLSRSWYDRANKDENLKTLKGHIGYYFRKYLKDARAKDGDIMWTSYGDYEKVLSGERYTRVRTMTAKEKSLPEAERDRIEKETKCFVPCNAKATNIYRLRWALAYCVNMYFHPMQEHFFIDGNAERAKKGLPPIEPDRSLYALSVMLQWIFRSRIRDDLPIEIYVPSTRMRNLLIRWLDNSI